MKNNYKPLNDDQRSLLNEKLALLEDVLTEKASIAKELQSLQEKARLNDIAFRSIALVVDRLIKDIGNENKENL